MHAILLLQPAVNRWCFAAQVIGTDTPGGYRVVLDRVTRPVVTTWSEHDKPLREFFHLAVRGGSLGEADIAAVGDTTRYGALGGYGPQPAGADLRKAVAQAPGTGYDVTGGVRVLAVDGTGAIAGRPAIGGHSDISTPPPGGLCTGWSPPPTDPRPLTRRRAP